MREMESLAAVVRTITQVLGLVGGEKLYWTCEVEAEREFGGSGNACRVKIVARGGPLVNGGRVK